MGASPRALLSVRAMLLWLVLACLLPELLGTGFMLQRDYQKGRAQQDAEMLLVAQALLTAVDTQLDVNRKVAQALALAPELLRGDLESFHRKASALLPKLDFGSNIVVSDRSGQMLINTGKPWGAALPINSDVAKIKTVFETAEPWIGGMLLGAIDGKYKFQTLAPVITNDRVSLVVSVSNQSEQMSRILQNQHLPPAWLGVIIDSQGHIAGRSQEAEAYVGRKAADHWIRAGTSNQGSFDANTLAGIESRIAFSRSPATKWTVGLAIPLENLEAPLWRSLTELSLSALAMLGLALGMAWLVAGRISHSVNSLLASAQALAEGKAVAVSEVHFNEAEFVAMAMAHTASLLLQKKNQITQTGQLLQLSESRYRELVEASPDAIVVSRKGRFVYVNAAAATTIGATAVELIGRRAADFIQPEFLPALRELRPALADQAGFSSRLEIRCLKANGAGLEAEVRSRAMLLDGQPAIQSLIRDVTEHKQLLQSQRWAALLFEQIQTGAFITDAAGVILSINPAMTEISGYTEDDLLGQNLRELHPGIEDKAFYQRIWHSVDSTGHWQGEIRTRRKNGEIYSERFTIRSVYGPRGELLNHVCTTEDLTNLRLSEEMTQLAQHDALTGLPNRRQLQTRIEHALAVSKRQQSQGALLFFDLDRFKAVNDAWGHAAGDDLLQRVALRISERMRDTDLLARMGGDEFVLLLETLDGPAGAAVVASDVLRLLSQPFMLAGGQQASIGCSIGIAMFPADGGNFTALLAQADAAQYRAKAEGRNRFCFHAKTQT
jgi:diguanylate cyclase (GGDEF)-like protein/PAS domain S-box-containing protein